MVRSWTKPCASVSYGILPMEEFLAEDSEVGEFLVCAAELPLTWHPYIEIAVALNGLAALCSQGQ